MCSSNHTHASLSSSFQINECVCMTLRHTLQVTLLKCPPGTSCNYIVDRALLGAGSPQKVSFVLC